MEVWKSVVNKILWVAVQVADFLSKRMFLTKNVLAFGWMGSEALRGADLRVVFWICYSVGRAVRAGFGLRTEFVLWLL